MFKKMHLRTRMTLSIISVVVLIFILMTAFNYSKSSSLIEKEAFSRTQYMAEGYAKGIETSLEKSFVSIRKIRDSIVSLKKHNLTNTRDPLIDMIRDNVMSDKNLNYGSGIFLEPNVFDSNDTSYKKRYGDTDNGRVGYWYRKDGKGGYIMDPTTAEQEIDMEKDGVGDWYLLPKRSLKEMMIEPYDYATASGEKLVLTSPTIPIIIDNKFFGIVSVDMTLNTIIDVVNNIKPYEVGYAILVDSAKNVVSHPIADKVMKPLENEALQKLVATSVESNASMSTQFKDNNENFFFVTAPIKLGDSGKSWSLIIAVPTAKVLEGSTTLAKIQTTFAIVSVLIISLIIYIMAQSISKPLTVATENINNTGIELLDNSKKLMMVSEKLSSSSTEQSAALVETATAMDEINAMVQMNTQAAKKGKTASENSNKSAHDGKDATDNMIQSIRLIREATTKLSEQTNRSNAEVQEIINIFNTITDKTKVINDIVFQTKLLSFNASVEAARAGEQGKGFAVVAEEVGKLAEMSGKSSQEISSLLTESTQKIENIISSNKSATTSLLHEAETKVTTGIKTAEDCAEALDKILTNSIEVSALVDEIFSASEQQAAGVAEVSKAIAELEVAAQANSNLASESASASQVINQKSDELKVVSHSLTIVIEGDKSS